MQKNIIAELLKKHDEDYILANIRVVEEEIEKGKEIHSIPAYLMKAFEVDFRPEKQLRKVREEEEKRKKEQEEVLQHRQVEEKNLHNQYEQEKNIALETLLKELNEESLKTLKEEFITTVNNNALFSKILESK